MPGNIPIEIYISIGLLLTNFILLMINISAVTNSKKQLEANDAPRILIQQKKEKFSKDYILVDIINVGNGLAIDAFCILNLIDQEKENNYFLSKPSREILSFGEYTFYFSLRNKDIDMRDVFKDKYTYDIQVVYKDFFGQYYQAGYNLPEGAESTHLEKFADEGKKLKNYEIDNIKQNMDKAKKQNNHYTLEDHKYLKSLELDLLQRARKYNKYSE